jgi:hypothetical protein
MIPVILSKSVAYQVSKVNHYYVEDLGLDSCSIHKIATQAFGQVRHDRT